MTVTRMTVITFVMAAMLAVACGVGSEPEAAAVAEGTPKEVDPLPALLDRPFTADQIRDEWIEGFEIRVRRWTPTAEAFEVWTVVGADSDGVEIESKTMDEAGVTVGEAHVQTSTWVQLRDHESFPVDRATRESVSRETPLGELQGWLYTVSDPSGGSVTEFFFAEILPGAPVFVHVRSDGEIVEIFEQVERVRP
jgi:hypothetical protein